MFPLQSPIFYLTSRDCPPGSPSAGHSGPGSVPGTLVPWPPSAPACRRGGSGQCCVERPPPSPSPPCCPSCCLATLSLCHCHVTIGSAKGDNLKRCEFFLYKTVYSHTNKAKLSDCLLYKFDFLYNALYSRKNRKSFFF